MPDFAEIMSADYWREHSIVLAYAVGALILFVVFIIGTFPYDQALTGALMPLGLEIAYASERPGLPVGAVFEGVRLISVDHPAAAPLMQSESLKLVPGLGILVGHPSVGLRARMYGGQVKAQLWRRGDVTGLYLDAAGIDLSRYPMPPAVPPGLKGTASAIAELQSFGPALTSQSGTISLDGHSVELPLIKGLPPLRFARLQGSCTIDHATVRVNMLQGDGPDLAISGSGVIHLGPTPAQTMIDLSMRITPTIAGRARLGLLFAFLPHPPDNRPYIFHGPLLAPQAS